MFCKTCGTLLRPKKTEYGKWMACPNGHTQPQLQQHADIITSTNSQPERKIEVADSKNILAVHDHKCKKCGNDKAQLREISCSYSDEDNIYQMICGKCGFVEQLEGKVK